MVLFVPCLAREISHGIRAEPVKKGESEDRFKKPTNPLQDSKHEPRFMAEERSLTTGASKDGEGVYRLHNSDHPGMALVNTTLDGKNYFAWSIAMRTALEAKDKVGFVDGSVPEPEDAAEHKKWKMVDLMVKTWVTNSLSKEIADTFVYYLSTKALWDVLARRYGVRNAPHIYQIQRHTSSVRQGGDSVTLYYNKLHRCWDEMDRVMPAPTCSCSKCTCGLNKKITDIMASIRLLQFLMGLNPVYNVVRTQILNLDPLLCVDSAYAIFITDEAQREIGMTYSNNMDNSSLMLVKTQQGKNDNTFKKREQSKKDKVCEHCNGIGHTKETCFKIRGYPEWWKELKDRRAAVGKKTISNLVADKNVGETPINQEADTIAKGDLTNVVSYLLKEVQRLGKNKASGSKDEQVHFANLHDFAENKKTLVSRDVIFYEQEFPFASSLKDSNLPLPLVPVTADSDDSDPLSLPSPTLPETMLPTVVPNSRPELYAANPRTLNNPLVHDNNQMDNTHTLPYLLTMTLHLEPALGQPHLLTMTLHLEPVLGRKRLPHGYKITYVYPSTMKLMLAAKQLFLLPTTLHS
ncbi:uncharacterized protein G2W53_004516 [Senna tora]|uniref:Retrotransposon Copia-like N-terminal domain-containing protein n=1 Tax=Senna tora TaxID=362788 RepID=A0A834XFC1_9FABA|nr:uncharacterized protein G2W53_004516 [Senna tora]